jgi:hypothetical protein
MPDEQLYGLTAADVQAIKNGLRAANDSNRAGETLYPSSGAPGQLSRFRIGRAKADVAKDATGNFFLLSGDHADQRANTNDSVTIKAKALFRKISKDDKVLLFLSEQVKWYAVLPGMEIVRGTFIPPWEPVSEKEVTVEQICSSDNSGGSTTLTRTAKNYFLRLGWNTCNSGSSSDSGSTPRQCIIAMICGEWVLVQAETTPGENGKIVRGSYTGTWPKDSSKTVTVESVCTQGSSESSECREYNATNYIHDLDTGACDEDSSSSKKCIIAMICGEWVLVQAEAVIGENGTMVRGRYTGSWPKDSSKTVTIESVCTQGSSGSSGSSGCGECHATNYFLDLDTGVCNSDSSASHKCIVAMICGEWVLVQAENKKDDLTSYPGYSAGKKQALTHENGCLKWIDIEECSTQYQ